MLLSLNNVKGHDIKAVDGTLGKARDFFFDDRDWAIRYLVVDTGWLFGRDVLVSPEAIEGVNAGARTLSLALTREQIENAPGTGTDLPVSRQEERALREHHGWLYYWDIYPAGVGAAPLIPPMVPKAAVDAENSSEDVSSAEADARAGESGDQNLRSAREVEGYHIHATDGEIGHVEDFMLDDENWTIRYIVVDTRNWLPGRKVLVAPSWADGIDWAERLVLMNVNRDKIEQSPEYDPSAPVSRDYESVLWEHYGHKSYWL